MLASRPARTTRTPLAALVSLALVPLALVLLTLGTGGVLAGTAGATTYAGSCGSTNVALGAPASASSVNGTQTAAKAVDGSTSTRWASAASDPQWLQVDLGSSRTVCQVGLNWAAYASAYAIQASDDATNWTTLISTGATANALQSVAVTGHGRYLRMYGTARGKASTGYSLKEFQVFTPQGQAPAFTSSSTATFVIGQAGSFTVTTSGVPTVSTITESGSLPAGVTFTDNGN
ncbi:MAG TPA: discoidin domain-containing protein, partial [Jatrophihabitans sp.]|nr:discoidin domain-containing protein [Jatrophihabitans sp.]